MPDIKIVEDAIRDDDAQTELVQKSRERDETQVALDTAVGELAAAWVKAKRPGPETAPKKRYVVQSKDAAVFKAMIRRACTLHKVGPVWFKDVKRDDGTTAVKFAVGPPAPKRPKKDAAPAPAAG